MFAQFPISGVISPTEVEWAEAFNNGYAIERTAGDLFRHRAMALEDKTFLISETGQTSYREFDIQTEILAAALLQNGLVPGDRALFQMGTIRTTLVALFACYKAGIIPVCTLPQFREHEIAEMIRLTEPRAYFVQEDYSTSFELLPFAEEIVAKYGSVRFVVGVASGALSIKQMMTSLDYDAARRITGRIKVDARDVITFQLSGGSTGVPKIIPRFHGEYLGQANSIVARYALAHTDIGLWTLPLIHNAGMILMAMPIILAGGTLVLRKRFEITDYVSDIRRFHVTYTGSIGPIAQSILDFDNIREQLGSSIRVFFTLERAEEIERHIGVATTNTYGITEGLLMTSRPDDPPELRFGTTGYQTGGGDQILVVRPGTEAPVEFGQEGELCFKGPHKIRGYFNAPEINRKAFTSDGYFKTGDLVRVVSVGERTGYRFLGRLKDNISRGGEKFSAEEVEQLIVSLPAIADVKVVAMPDRLLGEKACAFVVVKKGERCPTVSDLSRQLDRLGLARYKHPERIEQTTAFPVTKVGKVDKAALRQIIADLISEENGSHEPEKRETAV